MKKIISILFLFLLCYACYYIYNNTEDNKLYLSLIGDELANNPYFKTNDKISKINKDFVNDMKEVYKLTNTDKINKIIKDINMVKSFLDVLK